jgi:DNA-binding MltR family transcriptional regulator
MGGHGGSHSKISGNFLLGIGRKWEGAVASRKRGKPKIQIHDLSRLPLDYDDETALSEALDQETHPIAIAILGAVMVEHELEKLLRPKFKRKDDRTWNVLVKRNGPLSTFSSKIVTGYAFGIYKEDVRDDLDIVRNIRNAFAHSKKLIDFDHPAVVEELTKASKTRLPVKYRKNTPVKLYAGLCWSLATKLIRIDRKRYRRRRVKSPFAKAFATSLGGLAGMPWTSFGIPGPAPGLPKIAGLQNPPLFPDDKKKK